MQLKSISDDERANVRRMLMWWGNAERAIKERYEKIANIDQEIQSLYEIKPQELTGMPHATDISNPTEKAVIVNEKQVNVLRASRKRIEDEIKAINNRASAIEFEIMCLPPLESEVIRLRYMRYGVAKSGYWLRIANTVHVSIDHAKTLERHGVDRLHGRLT